MAKKEIQKEEQIEIVQPEEEVSSPDPVISEEEIAKAFAPFIGFLNAMKTTKGYIEVAPTDTPKNFYESIRFYDTGGVRRLYLFINGDWRYVVLT